MSKSQVVEGHGWVEKEEPETRNEKLNVYSYIQKQGNSALGWCQPPQNPCRGLMGGNMQCSLVDQKVSI